jgi:DamX protein
MSSINNSAAEPSYLTRLALSSAPFNNAINAEGFYHGEQIEQRLNLLFHLLRASDKVPCVVAVEGGGKSSLLTQLQHDAGDELRVCRIDAEASLTATKFMESCLRAFGVDETEIAQTTDYESVLRNRLQRLLNLNIRSVVLVDDIDHMEADVVTAIFDCLSWQEEDNFLLHAVLTASKAMPEWEKLHGRSQRVELPNLTEQELPLYLMHRLVAVAYLGEIPFSEKDLKNIYRQSEGCPAKVNELAHQKLLRRSAKQLSLPFNFPKIQSLLKWLTLGLLITSLILLLVFQQQINALFSGIEKEPVKQEEEFSYNEADEQLTTVIVGEDKVTSIEQAGREELTSLVATLAEQGKEEPEPQIEAMEAVEKNTVIDLVEVEAQLITTLASSVHQEDWIKQQQGTDYTFQLMGSWEHAEVIEFIDKYALSDDTAEFQSMRNGRVWYALIYGVYPDKKTALKASQKWPTPLNTLPSWLRRFDSVQKQIKNKAQVQ